MDDPDGRQVSDIAKVFAEVFEADSVSPDDDFFDLGGDSLLATTLMAAIERDFGTALPISMLLEAATPRALAPLVFAARQAGEQVGDSLVEVNREGSGTPLFCVHGMRGEAVFPRRLADLLGTERPIYGFRAIGLLAGERPLSSVAEIVDNYLRALRRVHRGGPVVLLGICGGSMIAYEMAQRLIAEEETVAGLILIDPPHSQFTAPFLFLSGSRLLQRIGAAQISVSMALATFDASADLSDGKRRLLLTRALQGSVAAYTPKPYGGPALLLHSTVRKRALLDRQRGFPTLLADLRKVEIPTDHMNLFEQHMPEVTEAIARFLERKAEPEQRGVEGSLTRREGWPAKEKA